MSVNYEDNLYDELSRLNNELVNAQRELAKKNASLEAAAARIRRLEGLLPICMHCHSIRDEGNIWSRIEEYIEEHADVSFSHGICPDCLSKFYPEDQDAP